MIEQLDLFIDTAARQTSKSGILYDLELDGFMWRAVLHAEDNMALVFYRGEIGDHGRYYPVSGCHLVSMPYTTDRQEVARNIRAGEAAIASGLAIYKSARIEAGQFIEAQA